MLSPTSPNSTPTPNLSKLQLNANHSLRSWMNNTQLRFKLKLYTFTNKTPTSRQTLPIPEAIIPKGQQKKQSQAQKQVLENNWGEIITPVKEVNIKEEMLAASLATQEKEASQSSDYTPNKSRKKKKKVVKRQKRATKKKTDKVEKKLF